MTFTDELYALFRRNLHFIVREEATARTLLSSPENHTISRRDESGNLIAACVINKNAVYLICVDEKYRSQGIGGEMLSEAEAFVRSNGFDEISIGVGDDYLMPGVPSKSMIYEESLIPGEIYPEAADSPWQFFKSRGYTHSWGDCNCFDMRQNLTSFDWSAASVGDIIDGITYRWANESDIPAIARCTDDAHEEFTKYYLNPALYNGTTTQKVLVAANNSEISGVLIVSRETEGAGTGSVGCTAVRHSMRGRHIAANMVLLGSKWLKAQGMTTGFLGYTYSGLDKLYGIAGYRICIYYAMAAKKLA